MTILREPMHRMVLLSLRPASRHSGIELAAPATVQRPGDAAPHVGEGVVGELHEVEVVDHHGRVGQQIDGDRRAVGRGRVDHHIADRVPKLRCPLAKPAGHGRRRPAFDLP